MQCSAERPTCAECRRRRTECVYDTQTSETPQQARKRKWNELEERSTTLQEIFGLLRSRSEREAKEIYRRIRDGTDVLQILRLVKAGDLLLQMTLVPDTKFRFQLPANTDCFLNTLPPRQELKYTHTRHQDGRALFATVDRLSGVCEWVSYD